MSDRCREVRLSSKPDGVIKADDFSILESADDRPGPGDLLVEPLYLSLDPYLALQIKGHPVRGRILAVGEAMRSRMVGRVIESRCPGFEAGDCIRGVAPWRTRAVVPGSEMERIDTDGLPPSYFLGVLGTSGITAWIGLHRIGRIGSGETVIVSGAAGTVGGIAGQLAKLAGCRVVGIAGGERKCRAARELGFDLCLDYRSGLFEREIRSQSAQVYFENVGGHILDAVLPALADHARIVLCGMIAHYEAKAPFAFSNLQVLLERAVSMQAFRVSEHGRFHGEALGNLSTAVRSRRLRSHETISQGLESAPAALVDMLAGRSLGKTLVSVSPDR